MLSQGEYRELKYGQTEWVQVSSVDLERFRCWHLKRHNDIHVIMIIPEITWSLWVHGHYPHWRLQVWMQLSHFHGVSVPMYVPRGWNRPLNSPAILHRTSILENGQFGCNSLIIYICLSVMNSNKTACSNQENLKSESFTGGSFSDLKTQWSYGDSFHTSFPSEWFMLQSLFSAS